MGPHGRGDLWPVQPGYGNATGYRLPLRGWQIATGKWPIGRGGFARDAIPPVPPKTARSGPQPSKSAIESHLRIAEYFRVHGPVSTSEFAAVSTPPPQNNSLRYTCPGGCNAFMVLGVTKHTASGIRTGRAHWIQTSSFHLVRQSGFN